MRHCPPPLATLPLLCSEESRLERKPDPRPWGRWWLIALLVLILSGCTRAHYRHQADNETYGLIGCATGDPRWHLTNYSINPSVNSRMFDPDNPDRPPMPPDDPTSQKLMQCVDGMRGWPHWHRDGDTPYVENPCWTKYLACGDDGALVLDRPAAVQVALLDSREYQRALEELYLSALDVTFQRFRFDAQFFGSNSTFFTADGPQRPGGNGTASRLLDEENSLQVHKLSATGGELIAGIANSLMWQFAGPDQNSFTSLLNFSMVQPLLRAGGRAVVMENLTQAERTLLADVRQMERFRHGFYVQIVSGRSLPVGPIRSELNLDSLQPNLFGNVGGIFSLMAQQVRIRNQRASVIGRRRTLNQLEDFFDAGRIDNLQVDQSRQQLFGTQVALATLKQSYQDSLDTYKITLGLPPELPIRIDDPLLKPFNLIDEKTLSTQDTLNSLLAKLRDPEVALAPDDYSLALSSLPRDCHAILEMMAHDLELLDGAAPARRELLQLVSTREELTNGDVDPSAASMEVFNRRLTRIRTDFVKQQAQLQALLVQLEKLAGRKADRPAVGGQGASISILVSEEGHRADETPTANGDSRRKELTDLLTELAYQLAELSLTQARSRVETVTLVPVQLGTCEALQVARQNRLDWMNARAALVDSWRQIEVTANALRGDLNVTLAGDMTTLNNNPLRFRSTTGRLQAGVQFDPPLTRLAERNLYREALINYQQARRQYYAYEDRVSQSLRDILRTIDRYELDFELRRAAVHVAINQVEVMQLRLQQPPKPGEVSVFGPTTARDIDQALTGLLNAQNDLLNAWVDYESQRLNLDFDLGTMQLDAQNNWVDPGPIRPYQPSGSETPRSEAAPEELPAPEAMPMPESLPTP